MEMARIRVILTLLALGCFVLPTSVRADLVAHFTMDGFIEDETRGLEGTYLVNGAGDVPATDTGYDDTEDGAIAFDAANGNVVLVDEDLDGLVPLYNHGAYSVAMWVKGDGTLQADDRVYSESTSLNNRNLLNIGTHNTGADGSVDIYIRGTNENGSQFVAYGGHRYSTRPAFDGTWQPVLMHADA